MAFCLFYGARHWIFTQRNDALTLSDVGTSLLFGIAVLLVFWRIGLYTPSAGILYLTELEKSAKGVALAALVFLAFLVLIDHGSETRSAALAALPGAGLIVMIERRLLCSLAQRMHVSGRLGSRVLVYGCGETAKLLMKKIAQAPHSGRTVIGFIDDSLPVGTRIACRLSQVGETELHRPVLGGIAQLRDLALKHEADELVVTAPGWEDPEAMRELLRTALGCSLRVSLVPHVDGVRSDQLQSEEIAAIPLIGPRDLSRSAIRLIPKRIVDLVVSIGLLLVTLPLWAVIALLVRLESRGPVFFRQDRIGLRGRPFRMLKFRTMYVDSEPYATSPRGNTDPRITRVGGILRRTGLDELPQLLNVIRGDMSLVGPRPEMPFIVRRYSALQRERLEVRPGITGIWQLSGDRYGEIHENIEYDLYYIHNQSLLLDLLILLETGMLTVAHLARLVLRRPRGRRLALLDPQSRNEEDPRRPFKVSS